MGVERRDVVIIGAGPAGAAAARECALAGLCPLLVERDGSPGAHSACGGIAAYGLRHRLSLPDDVVERELRRMVLTIDGRRFEYAGQAPQYISFRRAAFDAFLARRAVEAGAELLTSTRAGILDPARRCIGLSDLTTGRQREVEAEVIIFADGPATLAADAYGIGHRPGPRTRRAAFIELEGCYGDGETSELVLSTALTKGEFWLFPKRDCVWVGVGGTIGASGGASPRARLEGFIAARDDLRDRRISHSGVGLVPSDVARELASDGCLVVGDAAGLVNPMTGGGIVFALASGEIAGGVVADAIKARRTDRKTLSQYPCRLHRTPQYLWLAAMGLWRRSLDRREPGAQPAAYARMLRQYLSAFHWLRPLVRLVVAFPRHH